MGRPKLYNLGKRDVVPDGVDIVLDCTSHNKDAQVAKDLSPFYLGPLTINGVECMNFENAWQFSKCYKNHLKRGQITDGYYQFRDSGYANKKAVRYPMGRGAVPEFSLLDGNQLSYVEARQQIYLPMYAALVVKTKTFKWLRKEYFSGKSIAFRDFDGYDHRKLGYSYQDVILDARRKMGHGSCLPRVKYAISGLCAYVRKL